MELSRTLPGMTQQRGFVISDSALPIIVVSLMFSGILGGLYLWRRLRVRRVGA